MPGCDETAVQKHNVPDKTTTRTHTIVSRPFGPRDSCACGTPVGKRLRQPCKNTTFPTRQPCEVTPSLADLSAYEIRVRVGLQSGNALFSPIFQQLIRCTGFFTLKKHLTICCRFGVVRGLLFELFILICSQILTNTVEC